MIVFTLISMMMVLSLPILSTANERARSELCQQNLIEISQIVVQYTQDTDRLPTIHNLQPIHEGISLPEFVRLQHHTPNVLFCPSDESDKSQLFETSYQWSSTFNGRAPGELTRHLGQRLLSDRETFHQNAEQFGNEIAIEQDQNGLRLGLLRNHSLSEDSNTPSIYFKPKKPKRPNHPQGSPDDHEDEDVDN